MAKPKSGGLLENVKTILYAGLIAIGIRTVAFEPFNIPSSSMEPTLLVGDYLFVSKYSYGYSRYSMPFSPNLFQGRLFGRLPERGDVVVFKWPYDTSIDYIKRVIGLPGDHVQTRGSELYINGTLVPRVRGGVSMASDGSSMQGRLYTETLPNGRQHEIKKLSDEGYANNTPDFLVPADQLFVMGDNRDNSADSRFMDRSGVGFLPLENLVGRAEFLFFSIDATHPWWEIWGMAVRDPLVASAERDQVNRGDKAPHQVAERMLGYTFTRSELLTEALMHRSAAHRLVAVGNRSRRPHERRGVGSNERLEFVGDRVLGLVVAEWLIERFPLEQEGELGRRFGHLVSRPVLAEIAGRLGLEAALAIAPNEARAGVGGLANTLADAMEAVIGAMFLDAGLDVPRRFVREAWAEAMELQVQPPKDAKTSLQEWMMARGLALPEYVVSDRSGPSHLPEFVVTVSGAGQSGTGTAGNKREAERAAAVDLLGKLQ